MQLTIIFALGEHTCTVLRMIVGAHSRASTEHLSAGLQIVSEDDVLMEQHSESQSLHEM
jgi:hypothetical protein